MKSTSGADASLIRLNTPFGDFEAAGDSIVTFADGLPGFEQCRRFVILSSMATAPLQLLHAVDGPPATFLTIDPFRPVASSPCHSQAVILILVIREIRTPQSLGGPHHEIGCCAQDDTVPRSSHLDYIPAPARRDRPRRLHCIAADPRDDVVQVDDDADMIRDDSHLLADARLPIGR